MADEQPAEQAGGRRRSRGSEALSRSSALERLKALRSGLRRPESAQIKLDQPIYDTVDEEEYSSLVSKRKEEAKGFIIDDDGLGYGDEGEEEDWSKAGYMSYSDEEDEENGERATRKKKKIAVDKKEVVKKVTVELSAAAALMGRTRISSMFTSNVFKKIGGNEKMKGLSDSIVDDVIAEFAPDEEDREKRRRGPVTISKGKTMGVSSVGLVAKHEEAKLGNGELGTKEKCELATENESLIIKNDWPNNMDLDGEAESMNVVKEELEPVAKQEEVYVLNAKVKDEKEVENSATAGWKEVKNVGSGNVEANLSEEKSDFELDSDGSLPFHILDAYEELYGVNMGTVYLFGKVKVGSSFQSCCVVVKNIQRCVFAVPNASVFKNDAVARLEKDAEESRITTPTFRAKLQEVASEMKNEVAKHLLDINVSTFSMSPVKRKYVFDQADMLLGDSYVLKINYPYKDPPLSVDLKGETFSALLGTHCSALELFLIKRKIKGPSWLSISKFSICPTPKRVSWCKFEVIIDNPKDIQIPVSSKDAMEIPPVVVTAINLKTVINEKQNVNEIVSASIICCHKVKIDSPMLASEWKKPEILSHFTVIRKLEGGIFPMGFTKEVTDRNLKARSNVLGFESSERALLNRLMIELYKLDSDFLVGHNISGFDLDILLHRAQACRVPNNMWSKLGRLKRSTMPRITKGNTVFGSGASPGIMSCVAGRLLCDTFLSSRDLLKEVSYSLTQLAKTQLNKDRKEIAPHDMSAMFQKSETLMELVEYGETDAWLSLELMFHLSVLPLTRQLTNISGNLWGKTLQGARAQRVEFLLLHAFHAKKFIVPDKISSFTKERKMSKRRMGNNSSDGKLEDLDIDGVDYENDLPLNEHGKGKKGPAYSGGLVLEPKKGLYDKYILLLDFNSLYPSIIQEYNICFTTVERHPDDSVPRLPSTKTTGVLPELLKYLVDRRRRIKQLMKTASGLTFQQLDIRQQALKLTANSMYGCLGFSNSRFYAKPLAELITLQGREILQSTVDLVQNNLNLEVIYGDTDSIMIYTGLDDIDEAKKISGKVIHEVNKKYRCLEIDLDGLYKRMLLLKKKKYAAVKLQFRDGKPFEVIERKGLDMVRRDWSLLSKELGDFCLGQILSGGSCDDVVESIHDALMKIQEEMRNGEVSLEKYVITKSLTKPPEAYPDGKNQPHAQVALRLKQSGYTAGCSAGDTVPYVICYEQGTTSSGSSSGIAQRARHPDELKRDAGKWMIDIDYYLSQQIHPVVSRLCASIQGTSPERLADCLGLDSSKFRSKSGEINGSDSSSSFLVTTDDDERFRSCEPLVLSCPSCSSSFECPTVISSIKASKDEKQHTLPTEVFASTFWCRLRCPKCPEEGDVGRISPAMIANQVKRQAEGFISLYYKGSMMCDDETCKYSTRCLNLRVLGDSERGTVCPNYPHCNGRLVRKYTEADLYKQLRYFSYVLDTVRCFEKVDVGARLQLEKELAKIRPVVELAYLEVQKIMDRCAYGWVQLKDLTVTV